MSEPHEQMMSIQEVCRFFGGQEKPVDQSTIYRWVRQGRLPPSVSLGPLLKRWRKSDCQRALDVMAEAGK